MSTEHVHHRIPIIREIIDHIDENSDVTTIASSILAIVFFIIIITNVS